MNQRLCRTNRGPSVLAAAGALAVFLAVCPTARAADVEKEVATAAEHAGYAADSQSIGMVHTHLHHTVNCLVGPNGGGFDANELNPCKDLGNGAIPDTTNTEEAKKLHAALELAKAGLSSNDLEAAKKLAARTEAKLKKAE